MIEVKSEREIGFIEESARIVRAVLEQVKKISVPGVTTEELNRSAEEIIESFGARSAFKGYKGFPASICTSINEEVVHGIPCKRKLKRGDILSIDAGVEKNGFYADAAVTIDIDNSASSEAKKLIRVTEEALYNGIKRAVEGNRLFDISYAIQHHAEQAGYSVVRDFVGHGIGRKMHEDPEIPNFGTPGTGPRLKKGMVLAIEPMINEGTYEIEILDDRWTAVTKDRRLSAHFEHTVSVGEKEPRVLT